MNDENVFTIYRDDYDTDAEYRRDIRAYKADFYHVNVNGGVTFFRYQNDYEMFKRTK